jgi:hypothetical protein
MEALRTSAVWEAIRLAGTDNLYDLMLKQPDQPF